MDLLEITRLRKMCTVVHWACILQDEVYCVIQSMFIEHLLYLAVWGRRTKLRCSRDVSESVLYFS